MVARIITRLCRLWNARHYQIVRQPRLRLFDRQSRKRALLCYLPEPILRQFGGEPIYNFSNDGLATSWLRSLRALGYAVDVISWEDALFRPEREYQLVIFHGAKNFEPIFKALTGNPKLIYFSTGSYWRFHNEQEILRQNYFQKRHGVKLPLDRFIESSEEEVNRTADAIICLGNEAVKQTYENFPAVFNLNIGSYPDPARLNPGDKDWEAAKHEFLFFSGGGNLHKGLDLLLDTFKNSPDKLHICTSLGKEFEEYYYDLLHGRDNITYHGVVGVRTPEYYEIVRRCGFVILPSCSEGSPGSVVECLQHGLVPIVSRETGIDIEGFGSILTHTTVETVASIVAKMSMLSPGKLLAMAQVAQSQAITTYAPDVFLSNLTALLKKATSGESR